MSEQSPHEHTHRYGPPAQGHDPAYGPGPSYGPGGPAPWPPYGPPQQGPAQKKRSRPGGVFVALVLAAALVLGGLAGLVGAAGFNAVEQVAGGATADVTRSTVSDAEDEPAPEGSVEKVANSVLPSVVKINVRGPQGAGSGSGVIISSDGEILTNNHVVAPALQGGAISVAFDDGSTARADVVGTDPLTDLAVIKARNVSDLTPAKLGASSNLDVGEQVVAIGSPFGLEATVTSGIVSALHRPVSVSGAGDSLATTYPAVQTDAAINPGNSGGPLVNMQGEVVGVNSSIRTPSSGSIGLGFAIPLDPVQPIIEQLRNGQEPTHAQLGVTVTTAESSDGFATAAGIRSVNQGSAAAEAGLRAGDVVTKVEEYQITGPESLVATIRGYRPGDTVTLTVVRDGDPRQIDVTLESDADDPQF